MDIFEQLEKSRKSKVLTVLKVIVPERHENNETVKELIKKFKNYVQEYYIDYDLFKDNFYKKVHMEAIVDDLKIYGCEIKEEIYYG